MKKKLSIIAVFCLIFAFGATSVYAALTLSSTSIASDGVLTITPTTNVVVSAGSVGIGTATIDPNGINTRLYVLGTSTNNAGLELTGNRTDAATVQADLTFSAISQTGVSGTRIALIRASTQGTNANDRGGSLNFYTKADNAGGITQKMIIDNTGNVGIGTTSPGSTLTVQANVACCTNANIAAIGASDDVGIKISNTATNGRDWNVVSSGGNSSVAGKFSIYDQTAGAFRLVINDVGNIGIGTTAPGASNLLELSSTTKGFVLPRMTKAQRDAIVTPVAGMAIYQTDNTPGLRVYNATNWMRFTETAD